MAAPYGATSVLALVVLSVCLVTLMGFPHDAESIQETITQPQLYSDASPSLKNRLRDDIKISAYPQDVVPETLLVEEEDIDLPGLKPKKEPAYKVFAEDMFENIEEEAEEAAKKRRQQPKWLQQKEKEMLHVRNLENLPDRDMKQHRHHAGATKAPKWLQQKEEDMLHVRKLEKMQEDEEELEEPRQATNTPKWLQQKEKKILHVRNLGNMPEHGTRHRQARNPPQWLQHREKELLHVRNLEEMPEEKSKAVEALEAEVAKKDQKIHKLQAQVPFRHAQKIPFEPQAQQEILRANQEWKRAVSKADRIRTQEAEANDDLQKLLKKEGQTEPGKRPRSEEKRRRSEQRRLSGLSPWRQHTRQPESSSQA